MSTILPHSKLRVHPLSRGFISCIVPVIMMCSTSIRTPPSASLAVAPPSNGSQLTNPKSPLVVQQEEADSSCLLNASSPVASPVAGGALAPGSPHSASNIINNQQPLSPASLAASATPPFSPQPYSAQQQETPTPASAGICVTIIASEQ